MKGISRLVFLESDLGFDVLSYITPRQNHSTPRLRHVPALFRPSVGTWLRTRSLDTWCLVWKPQSQHAFSDSRAGALGWCIDLALSVPRWVCRPFPEKPESLWRFSAHRQPTRLHSAFLTNDRSLHSKVIITVLLHTPNGGYQSSRALYINGSFIHSFGLLLRGKILIWLSLTTPRNPHYVWTICVWWGLRKLAC